MQQVVVAIRNAFWGSDDPQERAALLDAMCAIMDYRIESGQRRVATPDKERENG